MECMKFLQDRQENNPIKEEPQQNSLLIGNHLNQGEERSLLIEHSQLIELYL